MDIAAMIEKACPGSEIAEIIPRTGGQLSTVYEVLRNDASPVIVKIYAPEWAWKQAKEVHVYGLLAKHLGNAVPEVIYAGTLDADSKEAEAAVADQSATCTGGRVFTVLSKVGGVPLSEVEAPDWKAVYVQLGELQAKIHRVRQPAYGYLTDEVLEPLASNDAYMRRQFAKKIAEFDELGGDPELSGQIAAYVEEHAGLFAANEAPFLCHNDFHEGNVLVDPETWQVQGFIDVENAIAADPLMDLAKTECYSIWGNADKLAGLVEGYGELPADWRARTTLYRLYHSLELWDWFKSIGTVDPLDSIAGDMAAIVRP